MLVKLTIFLSKSIKHKQFQFTRGNAIRDQRKKKNGIPLWFSLNSWWRFVSSFLLLSTEFINFSLLIFYCEYFLLFVHNNYLFLSVLKKAKSEGSKEKNLSNSLLPPLIKVVYPNLVYYLKELKSHRNAFNQTSFASFTSLYAVRNTV